MAANTDPMSTTLLQPTVLRLLDEVGGDEILPGQLTYDCTDPYAISIVFQGQDGGSSWVFSRELLSRGLWEPNGDGDVHVFPGESDDGAPLVLVELCSDEEILIGIDRADVEGFLATSQTMVAPGRESEFLDIDAALAAIMRAAADDRA
jgi:hypothetical protein